MTDRDRRQQRPDLHAGARRGAECGRAEREGEHDPERDADYVVWGRRPVAEALQSGRQINRILVARGSVDPKIMALAKEKHVPVSEVDKAGLERAASDAGAGNHQGVLAYLAPIEYCDVDDLIQRAEALGDDMFIAVLDGIEDPQNLGSIIRTANAVGAHGVVIPSRRSTQVSPAVARASAGAVAHTPVARVTNLVRTLERLKQAGAWVVGTSPDAEMTLYEADLSGPIVVVVGNEGKGMSRLVGETCDFTVNIPMQGEIASLNAGVAWAVVAFEAARQRRHRQEEQSGSSS